MKRNFTFLIAAVALLVSLAFPLRGGAQTRDTQTATLTMSTAQASPVTVNGVTFTWTSANIVTGNGSSSGFKNNSNMTVTIPTGATLTKISKTNGNQWGGGATIKVYEGSDANGEQIASIVSSTDTYTISSNNTGTTYYLSNTSGKNAWITSLTIEYTTGSTPTYYTVSLTQSTGGTVSASHEQATEGTTVTLIATPSEGYSFDSWSITPNTVTITNNQFTMPNSNVTVSASWTQNGGGSGTSNVTYEFTSVDNFWIDNSYSTHPTATSSNSSSGYIDYGTFYYNNATHDEFSASGDRHCFHTSHYFFLGQTGALLTLPTYEGYKITKIKVHNSSSCSTTVKVSIVSGGNTASEEITWGTQNTIYSYDIAAAYQTSVLSLKIINDKNAQITGITVVREEINSNRVATPTFNPNGGIITEDTDVTISCETEEATIYYTLDGTTPTINSAVYSQAIPVSATTTIKAIAVKSGMDNSYEAEASYTRKYTITVNQPALGGTITASPLQAEAGNLITLNATPNEGYTFGEWSITPNVSMNGNSFEMPASNVTVSATFNQRPSFTITFTTNGFNDGSMQVYQGDAITTLPEATAAYIPEGYAFMGWYNGDYEVSNTAPIFITEDFVPTSDVTLKAVFAEAGSSFSEMNLDITISNFTEITTSYTTTYTHMYDEATVEAYGVYKNSNGIQMNSGKGTYIKNTTAMPGYITKFVLTWTASGKNSPTMYVNSGSVANTESTNLGKQSNQVTVQTIEIENPSDYNYNYFYFDGTTVTGACYLSSFKIYYMGTATSYSNYCTSVTEPIELPITGYTNGGGWNLIASPVVSIDPVSAGMITDEFVSTNVTPENGTYDLYRFNQSAELEWENYRVHCFALESGKGYLYASKGGVSIQFAGMPYNSNGEIPLVYDAGKDFAGWNLIGNPFGVAATLDVPYYRMNENQTTLGAKIEDDQIAAMEGVFVYAYDADEQQAITKATFTRAGRSNNASQGFVNLNLEQNASVVDNVIVRFDEGRSLPKLQLFKGSAKLFITKNGKDYAIVNSEVQGEMPVNFKAEENSTYTLSINTENVEMNYLHLVDNMTGMDVDLLQTPSYTFDATSNDYASRFRLVFSANDVNEQNAETFAFFSNGNWVVNNEGEATLQVIDVNGRIVSNETINGTVATSIVATPGVYMLRLVNGNEVKTQKIVVR